MNKHPSPERRSTSSRPVNAGFAPPALLRSESREEFEALVDQLCAAVKPVDSLEKLLVRELAGLFHEKERLQRYAVDFQEATAHEGLAEVIGSLQGAAARPNAVALYRLGNRETIQEINDHCEKAGVTEGQIRALGFVRNLGSFEQLQRMIAGVESRRNATQRELERRRDAAARRALRAAAEDIAVLEPSETGAVT